MSDSIQPIVIATREQIKEFMGEKPMEVKLDDETSISCPDPESLFVASIKVMMNKESMVSYNDNKLIVIGEDATEFSEKDYKAFFGENALSDDEKQQTFKCAMINSIRGFYGIEMNKLKEIAQNKGENLNDEDKKIFDLFDKCSRVIGGEELEKVLKKKEEVKATPAQSVTEGTITDQPEEKKEPVKSETDPLKVIAKMFQDKNLRLTEAIFGEGKKRIAKWRVNLRLKGVEFNEDTGTFNESTSRMKKNEVADIIAARKRTEFIEKLANLIDVINSKSKEKGLVSDIEKIDTTKKLNNKWFYRWTKKAVQQKVQPSKLAMFFKTHKNTKNDAIAYLANTLGITKNNVEEIAKGKMKFPKLFETIGLTEDEYKKATTLKQKEKSEQPQNDVGGNQPSPKTSDDSTKGSDDKKIGKFKAWINQKKESKDFINATKQKEKMQNFFKTHGYTEENLKEANIEGKGFDDLKNQHSKIIGLTTTDLQDNGKDKSNDEIIKICETRIKEINELKVLVEKAGGTAIGLPKLKKEVNDQKGSSKNDEANFHADLCNKLKTLCSKDTLENLKEFREEAKVLAKRRKFLQKQAGKGFKLEKDLTFQQLSTKLEDAIKDTKIFKQVGQQATSQGQQQ